MYRFTFTDTQNIETAVVSRKEIAKHSQIHSRDMKTQHMIFEIPSKRLSLLHYNLIHFNFALNIFLIVQFFKENVHPIGDVSDDVTRSLDVCHRQVCGSTVSKRL